MISGNVTIEDNRVHSEREELLMNLLFREKNNTPTKLIKRLVARLFLQLHAKPHDMLQMLYIFN